MRRLARLRAALACLAGRPVVYRVIINDTDIWLPIRLGPLVTDCAVTSHEPTGEVQQLTAGLIHEYDMHLDRSEEYPW